MRNQLSSVWDTLCPLTWVITIAVLGAIVREFYPALPNLSYAEILIYSSFLVITDRIAELRKLMQDPLKK